MSWLDDVVGILVRVSGVDKARRRWWNVIAGPTFTDDAANERLDVDFSDVRLQMREQRIQWSDLSSLPAGQTSKAFDLGAALPANAHVLGAEVSVATAFGNGGTCTWVTVDLGSTGDADAVVDGADVLAAPVDGEAATRPAGIAPNKSFAITTQLLFTIASDAVLNGFTSGDCTARVFFQER